jgi:hypothetical protein
MKNRFLKSTFLKLKFLHDKLHSVNARLMYVDLTGKKWFFELKMKNAFPIINLKAQFTLNFFLIIREYFAHS